MASDPKCIFDNIYLNSL